MSKVAILRILDSWFWLISFVVYVLASGAFYEGNLSSGAMLLVVFVVALAVVFVGLMPVVLRNLKSTESQDSAALSRYNTTVRRCIKTLYFLGVFVAMMLISPNDLSFSFITVLLF